MRIGIFTDTYTPEINGVVTSVLTLVEGLRARGHDVFVFAPSNVGVPSEPNVYRVASTALPVLRERRLATPFSAWVWETVRGLGLDVVHTHTEFGVGGFGFRARKQLDIPQVHTSHTVWEEYTHYLTSGFFDTEARGAVRSMTRRMLRHVDHVIAPTRKTADMLGAYGVTAPVTVIPTGVDLTRFAPVDTTDNDEVERLGALRERYGLTGFEQVLLMIGRIAPEKSVRELIDMTLPVLRARRDTCLLVVGGGPQLDELQRLTGASDTASQVRYTGEIAWSLTPDIYRISDVLIGNSHTETQGLTFIEATASGVPVVTRYNTCFDGIFEDGVNATLFTENAQFIPAVEAALDPMQRPARIEAGLEAARRLSKEVFAEQVEDVYRRLIGVS